MLAADITDNLRVYTVWLPIVITDFAAPSTAVLSRMPDRRVRQYWDPDHLVSKAIASAAGGPQPVPDCCDKDGILWDVAAVYPKGVKWEQRPPPAAFLNGPVVELTEAISAALR